MRRARRGGGKNPKRLAPVYRLLSWRSGGHTRKVSDVLVKHNIKAAADDLKIAGVGTNKVRATARTTGLRKAVTDVLDEETVEHVVFYNAEERPFKAVLYGMGDYTAEEAAGIGANDEARRRLAEGAVLLYVYVPGGNEAHPAAVAPVTAEDHLWFPGALPLSAASFRPHQGQLLYEPKMCQVRAGT